MNRGDLYLTALSGLVRHIPTDVLLGEVDRLLPILLQAIKTPVAEIKSAGTLLASLDTLMVIEKNAPATLSAHLVTLIPRLLEYGIGALDDVRSCYTTYSINP